MVVNAMGMKPAPSKFEATTNMPELTIVEELCSSSDFIGYPRNFVPTYSIIAAPLMDLLRKNAFASKGAGKRPIE